MEGSTIDNIFYDFMAQGRINGTRKNLTRVIEGVQEKAWALMRYR